MNTGYYLIEYSQQAPMLVVEAITAKALRPTSLGNAASVNL